MSSPARDASELRRAAVLRAIAFLALWFILSLGDTTDFPGRSRRGCPCDLGKPAAAAAEQRASLCSCPGEAYFALFPAVHCRRRRCGMARARSAPATATRVRHLSHAIVRRSSAEWVLHDGQPAARHTAGRVRPTRDRSSSTASTSSSPSWRSWPWTRISSSQRFGEARAMPSFLIWVAAFVLAMVALGLIRILRGPAAADRMMSVQLLGTGGIAALLLLAIATHVPALVDVAMTLALLAAFASVAFVVAASPAGPMTRRKPANEHRGRPLHLFDGHRRGPSSSWPARSGSCASPIR